MISFNTNNIDEFACPEEVSLSKAYHFMRERGNISPYDLFLPLDTIGLIVAQTLFLNRYEVNIIMKSYLEIWSYEQSKLSIPLYSLNIRLQERFQPIINMFFQNDVSKIVSLLLRMDKIFSHLFISRQQLNHFFQTYHLNRDDYVDIVSEITETKLNAPEDSFSIKKFINYFEKSNKFTEFIADFRNNCIKIGLNNETYKIISTKIKYYYQEYNSIKKQESCMNKTMRILFSNQPEPYRFDYSTSDPSQASFNGFLRAITKRFGAEVDRRASSVSGRSINKSSLRKTFTGSDVQRKTINKSIKMTMNRNARCSINTTGNNTPVNFASGNLTPLSPGNNSPVHRFRKNDNGSMTSLCRNDV